MTTLLQTASGDLDFTSGTAVLVGDDPAGQTQQALQELNNRFAIWKGEWFRDKRLGVPYVDFVLVKAPNMILIDSVFRQVITSVQNVASILSSSLSFNARARNLTASYAVQLTNGAVLTGGPGAPFIITAGASS